jgi:hypothetical protein
MRVVLMMPAAGWELALGRACVELSSAWLQLACRQDQREPQFALTLGCKTQHDHNNTKLQLVRVYIDIGSVACVDGKPRRHASELLDVCDGPAFGPGCLVLGHGYAMATTKRPRDQGRLLASFSFSCLPTWWLCKTSLRVDDFTSLTCGKAIGAVGMKVESPAHRHRRPAQR